MAVTPALNFNYDEQQLRTSERRGRDCALWLDRHAGTSICCESCTYMQEDNGDMLQAESKRITYDCRDS